MTSTEHDTEGTLGEMGSIVDLGTPVARRRVRRAPPAGRRADRRLRALRVLPADLPHLRPVGRGDGLAARPDLPDEGGPRGRADERLDGGALGRLPRLHGLRDVVPVRRAVRQADRADPRTGRAPPRALGQGQGAARAGLRAVPAPAAAAAAARPAAGAAGDRARPGVRRTGLLDRMAPQLAAMERLAPRLGKPEPLPERTSRRRAAAGRRRAAHRLRAARVLPRRQRRDGARARRRGLRRRRAAGAGLLRRAVGARRPRGRGPGVRTHAHRRLRGRRRRARRGQRRRLRVDHEGVRRAAGRRPGYAERAPGVRRRSATSPRSWSSWARSRRGTRSR